MIIKNLGRIVSDNYESLVHEAPGNGAKSRGVVFLLLGVLPVITGLTLGYIAPIWTDIISGLISAVGVLTGFSINAIVLLANYSPEQMYRQKRKVIEQTLDFTLYSVLVGIMTLSIVVFGYILTQGQIPSFGIELPVSKLEIVSVIVYSALAHYVVVLLVITHRLYTLINTLYSGDN